MPPSVKFRKEEIVRAALNVARQKGIDAVTAREVARELRVSVGPIFTWYDTMEQLKCDVYELAKCHYRDYIECGLSHAIPFFGIWQQYLRFAHRCYPYCSHCCCKSASLCLHFQCCHKQHLHSALR